MKRFDFGLNWKEFSRHELTHEKISLARESLKKLFDKESFKGLSFLDIGCGSGIFSLAASDLGANPVTGLDISPHSVEASLLNAQKFSPRNLPYFQTVDVLNKMDMRFISPADLVYAWGSLHHTGALYKAIEEACLKVRPGGNLVLAIYNKHWTSPVWLLIKRIYVHSPRFFQKIMIGFFYGLIYVTKFLVTGKNPLNSKRGMNFYFDVVDWVGGYPYEYASPKQITSFVQGLGFKLKKLTIYPLPTGNNEFLFVKELP